MQGCVLQPGGQGSTLQGNSWQASSAPAIRPAQLDLDTRGGDPERQVRLLEFLCCPKPSVSVMTAVIAVGAAHHRHGLRRVCARSL